MNLIEEIEQSKLKEELPSYKAGDSVKVNVKVSEGNRERIQTFEGVIIATNGVALNKTMTVRKLSFGVGVERIFPVHAPIVDSIEVIRKGKVAFFDTSKGFGFIIDTTSQEKFFVHVSGLLEEIKEDSAEETTEEAAKDAPADH